MEHHPLDSWVAVKELKLSYYNRETLASTISLKVQVPNNHILTQNLY